MAANLTATSSGAGRVDAWIDFDHNGTFGAGEQILANSIVAAGANPKSFTSYAATLLGGTYARFRLSSAGGLSATGPTARSRTTRWWSNRSTFSIS